MRASCTARDRACERTTFESPPGVTQESDSVGDSQGSTNTEGATTVSITRTRDANRFESTRRGGGVKLAATVDDETGPCCIIIGADGNKLLTDSCT